MSVSLDPLLSTLLRCPGLETKDSERSNGLKRRPPSTVGVLVVARIKKMTKNNLDTKAFVLVYSFRGRRVHHGREGTAVAAGTGR